MRSRVGALSLPTHASAPPLLKNGLALDIVGPWRRQLLGGEDVDGQEMVANSMCKAKHTG